MPQLSPPLVLPAGLLSLLPFSAAVTERSAPALGILGFCLVDFLSIRHHADPAAGMKEQMSSEGIGDFEVARLVLGGARRSTAPLLVLGNGAHALPCQGTLLPAFTSAADKDAGGQPRLSGPDPTRPYRKLKSFFFFFLRMWKTSNKMNGKKLPALCVCITGLLPHKHKTLSWLVAGKCRLGNLVENLCRLVRVHLLYLLREEMWSLVRGTGNSRGPGSGLAGREEKV